MLKKLIDKKLAGGGTFFETYDKYTVKYARYLLPVYYKVLPHSSISYSIVVKPRSWTSSRESVLYMEIIDRNNRFYFK